MFQEFKAAEAARTVHKHGYQKKVHLISGPKQRGLSTAESELELKIILAAELDPRITAVKAQPVTFDLVTGRKYSRREDLTENKAALKHEPMIYTPDVGVTTIKGENLFIEGKHSRFLQKQPETYRKLDALRNIGFPTLLMTEQDFPEVYARNLRILKPYTREKLSDDARGRIEARLQNPELFGKLLGEYGFSEREILTAVVQGILAFDFRKTDLNKKTLVRKGNGRNEMEVLPL